MIYYVNGIKQNTNGKMSDWWEKQKNTLKQNWNSVKDEISDSEAANIWAAIKKYNPLSVISRNSALALIRFNVFALATRLSDAISKNPKLIEEFWKKIGGTYSSLKVAVDKGKGKKILLGKKPKYVNGPEIDNFLNFEFPFVQGFEVQTKNVNMTGAEIAAAVVAASPVIIAIIELLKKLGLDLSFDKEEKELSESMKKFLEEIKENPAKFQSTDKDKPNFVPPSEKPDKTKGLSTTEALTALGTIAAIASQAK